MLPFAQPVGSFLRVVARFPGLGAGAGFVAGGLRLVRGGRGGQSRFLGDGDFRRRPVCA